MVIERVKPWDDITAEFLNHLFDGIEAESGNLGVEEDGKHQTPKIIPYRTDFLVQSDIEVPNNSVFQLLEPYPDTYNEKPIPRIMQYGDADPESSFYTYGPEYFGAETSDRVYFIQPNKVYQLTVDETNPPAAGDTAGPKSNTWVLEKGGLDFLCMTPPDDDNIAWFLKLPTIGGSLRVRVFDEIFCGEEGDATVLTQDITDPLKPCAENVTTKVIKVCNSSNRTIKCENLEYDNEVPHEDGWAHLDSTSGKYRFDPDRRSEIAIVTLALPLCGEEVTTVPGSERFFDVCSWVEKIPKIYNPMNRKGCVGDDIVVRWNALECNWMAWQPTLQSDDVVTYVSGCSNSCSDGDVQWYNGAAVETCDCSKVSGDLLNVQEVNFLQNVTLKSDTEGCSLMGQYVSLCTVVCDIGANTEVKQFDFTSQKVLTGLDLQDDAIYCDDIEVFVPCIGPAGSEPCIPLEPCPPPEDPVENV